MSDWTGEAVTLLLTERERAHEDQWRRMLDDMARRRDGEPVIGDSLDDEDLARAVAPDAQARCEEAASLRGAALVSIEHVRAYLGDVVNTSGWRPKGSES